MRRAGLHDFATCGLPAAGFSFFFCFGFFASRVDRLCSLFAMALSASSNEYATAACQCNRGISRSCRPRDEVGHPVVAHFVTTIFTSGSPRAKWSRLSATTPHRRAAELAVAKGGIERFLIDDRGARY
jgi:hypothetical protein